MRKLFLVLFITLFMTFSTNDIFAQVQLAIRKKIVPLHSSRKDVEKSARFVDNFGSSVRYETEDEFLVVDYSKQECIGHGWNVPADRVLFYHSYPKNELTLEEVLKINKNLIQIGDDTLTSHFINQSEGVEFVVRFSEQRIEYIGFSPSVADSGLRCKGFPEYSLASEHYLPYQASSIKNISTWDAGLIYATLAELKKSDDKKGYVFVYCKKGQILKCKELIKKNEKVASNVLKSKTNQLTITFGGYRSETEIETFLIPKDYPPVIARPTLPSN